MSFRIAAPAAVADPTDVVLVVDPVVNVAAADTVAACTVVVVVVATRLAELPPVSPMVDDFVDSALVHVVVTVELAHVVVVVVVLPIAMPWPRPP
jgi:hypothetical protein